VIEQLVESSLVDHGLLSSQAGGGGPTSGMSPTQYANFRAAIAGKSSDILLSIDEGENGGAERLDRNIKAGK